MVGRRPFFPSLFLIGVLLGSAQAGARRPPLPHEPMIVFLNGQVREDFESAQVEGALCLALRDLRRLFGGRESWRRVSRRFTYEVRGRRAEFALDEAAAVVEGRPVPLEIPLRWWGDQAYVPVSLLATREFQEFTETTVAWEPAQRILSVEPVPAVSSPRFYSSPRRSRVAFELGPRVEHRVLSQRGNALVIRFFGGRAGARERLEVQDPLITAVEVIPRGHSSDAILRFGPSAGAPIVTLEESPRRLVVETAAAEARPPAEAPAAPAPAVPAAAPVPAPLPAPEPAPLPAAAPDSPFMALSPVRTIVIDPGHGGKDAGAVGAHGTLEKDVNLRLAQALGRVLEREGRYRVLYTRQDDTFIPLEGRADFANKSHADLFVSVHCNAGLSRRSNGFEIYFLSEKATDEAAAAVARRENAVVELEGVGGKAKQKLQELLWSLAKTETLNESSEIAALIAKQVEKRAPLPNRGVKQAAFYVLKGATMPAVLVEAAFITHPAEEGLLRSTRYHQKLADALLAGIQDYERRKVQTRMGRAAAGGN